MNNIKSDTVTIKKTKNSFLPKAFPPYW